MAIDMRKQTAFTKRYRKKGRGKKPVALKARKGKWPSSIIKPVVNRVAVRTRYTEAHPRLLGAIFPNKLRVHLKWNKVYTVAAGTTDIATVKHFRLTSLFDPEYAASSSIQSYGFDQIMEHYGHYQVIGAKMSVHFIHNSGNNMIVGVIDNPGTSTTHWDSQDEFLNDPRGRHGFIGNEFTRKTLTVKYLKTGTFGLGSESVLKGTSIMDPAENYYGSTYSNNMGLGAT